MKFVQKSSFKEQLFANLLLQIVPPRRWTHLVVVMGLSLLLFVTTGQNRSLIWLLLISFMVYTFLLIASIVIIVTIARSQNKAFQYDATVTFEKEGVTVNHYNSQRHYAWSVYHHAIETNWFFFFFVSKSQNVHVISKMDIPLGQLEPFRKLVRHYMGNKVKF